MKRDIEWKERLEDGIRLIVRVKFPGQGKVKWQFKRAGEDEWDYDTPATPEQWAELEEKVNKLYHRRRAALRDWELVKKLKEQNS